MMPDDSTFINDLLHSLTSQVAYPSVGGLSIVSSGYVSRAGTDGNQYRQR